MAALTTIADRAQHSLRLRVDWMRVLGSPPPTPEQLKIIGDTRTGVEIIRGAAGSGKTATALLRLRNLSDMFRARHKRLGIDRSVNALVLTYNRTLCGYVEALAQDQAASGGGVQTTVQTYAQWARQFADEPTICSDRSGYVIPIAASVGVRLPQTFLVAEIEYVLGRYPRGQYDLYLEAERTGRGLSPRVERSTRERLLQAILMYQARLAADDLSDWEDLSAAALAAPSEDYDIVVVDEAQDFSANQLRSIRKHLANPHALTLVIDTAQRLYPRGYTWSEVGIDPRRTQFYRLSENHRNTVQIATFASGILKGLAVDDDGTLPDFAKAKRQGTLPLVLKGLYRDQVAHSIAYIRRQVDLRKQSVAFLHPLGGGWFSHLKRELDREALDYEEITRQREWPRGETNIVLSTMHSAKGLEFDHVIILGLNEQVTPHGSEEGDDQLLTLRRLMGMAVSRARVSVLVGYKDEEASSLVGYFEAGTYNVQDV